MTDAAATVANSRSSRASCRRAAIMWTSSRSCATFARRSPSDRGSSSRINRCRSSRRGDSSRFSIREPSSRRCSINSDARRAAHLPPQPPPSQPAPQNPTTPRVSMRKVRKSARHGHHLLGTLMADGMPLILPVSIEAADRNGLVFTRNSDLLPPGERRAGYLAHDFHPGLIGLWTSSYTGWLRASATMNWTPHTRRGFYAPPMKRTLLLVNGLAARWGYRQAVRQGRDRVLHTRTPGSAGRSAA